MEDSQKGVFFVAKKEKSENDIPRIVLPTPKFLPNNHKNSSFLFFLAVGLIGLILAISFLSKSSSNTRKKGFIFQKSFFVSPTNTPSTPLRASPTPIPTNTPTPSPTPTPTPIPLVGYCLYEPILMYHHISPQNEAIDSDHQSLNVDSNIFDQQMNYLVSQGYTTITADDLANALKNKTGLTSKPIMITVDDGYRDIYNYAYPIAKKYNLKINVMVITGLVEGNDYLTWDQIKEMADSGLVIFYPHTWSHVNLGGVTKEKAEFEISTSKRQLEERLGKSVSTFCYPYGYGGYIADQVLTENGFFAALSTTPGSYQCDSFIMNLHRTRIGNAPLSSYGF